MKRNFCIGSEWLFYKIYTGVQITDVILLEKLEPHIENLKAQNLIEKWFFIRYKDPHTHFRLRFYNKITENSSLIISRLYPVLNELVEQDVVWKIQTDTYQRELERYGEQTMEDSETLFWLDSEMIVDYLSIKRGFENEKTQLLFSFLAIDSFLNSFTLTNTQKLALLDDMQTAFKKEFAADKILRKEMDKHYRALFKDMESFLKANAQNDYPEIFSTVLKKQKQTDIIANSVKSKMEIPLNGFLTSHIHMMVNRQYTSRQRQYELLIYDHLHRYYKTVENENLIVKEMVLL